MLTNIFIPDRVLQEMTEPQKEEWDKREEEIIKREMILIIKDESVCLSVSLTYQGESLINERQLSRDGEEIPGAVFMDFLLNHLQKFFEKTKMI